MTIASRKSRGDTEKRGIVVVASLIGVTLIALVIGGVYYFLQAPQAAFANLRAAASAGDLATIQEYVDFPLLRSSVKRYLIAKASEKIGAPPEASHPVLRQVIQFGKMMVDAALDPVVDIVISPVGISALLDGFAPAENAGQTQAEISNRPTIHTSLESMDLFVVSIFRRESNRWVMQLFFVRSSLFEWKLAAIRPLS